MKVHQHHAASIIATSAPVVDAHLQTVAVTQQDTRQDREHSNAQARGRHA
ncbi:hypothetical protein [Burkholderia ambifaria]|nr:hypothetical protein [Burkholderia ambifaria]